MIRRISGILMQLTIFEIPQAIVQAANLSVTVAPTPPSTAVVVETGDVTEVEKTDDNQPTTEDKDYEDNGEEKQKEYQPEVVNTIDGFAELRDSTQLLVKFPPPAFRIVGYDPRSKRKVILMVEPKAIVEICGGVFSPYLDPERRKELSRVIGKIQYLFLFILNVCYYK